VSKDAFGRAEEVIAALGMNGKGDDDRGGVGQRTLLGNGCPPDDPGALEVKEEEDAAKEALDTAAFTQIGTGPGGREARAVRGAFRMPGKDGGGPAGGMDPGDQRAAPVGGIKADDTGTTAVESDNGGKEGLSKGLTMTVGGRDTEERREARAPAEHRVVS